MPSCETLTQLDRQTFEDRCLNSRPRPLARILARTTRDHGRSFRLFCWLWTSDHLPGQPLSTLVQGFRPAIPLAHNDKDLSQS